MARLVTLQNVADRARYYSDQRHSSFTDDTEMLNLINENYCELYDLLVAAYGENYQAEPHEISIVTGTTSYALPDDFYKMIGVDFATSSNGTYVTLKPFTEIERNRSLTTNQAIPNGTVRIRYVPAPEIFTDLAQTIDGISGWDRLLSLAVAIDIMDAEESDTTALVRKYNRTLERINEMSKNRDESMPGRVSDIYYSNIVNTYGALMYRMYGDNIEFISTEFLGSNAFPPMF